MAITSEWTSSELHPCINYVFILYINIINNIKMWSILFSFSDIELKHSILVESKSDFLEEFMLEGL